ncbi:MAG: tRNA (adenosine(37)-N6)-threonylcarbamoyltransferase complex ATPase subunit type 1 TsaE [Deltaproteobacteria bacterium]|nr:MAG: tRNA (adenosine(37)-N6)-threonylcarbamoyltransferase complex ATPase subunit type 1 TsaE [Deltaproteobacteria bacterium]
MQFRSQSPEATRAAARALGCAIGSEGLVVALCGPLGAGKTLFVKGLAAGLGIDAGQVASPTFVIASAYGAAGSGRPLAHVDLYRVDSVGELDAAGFLDLLAPGSVVAVEWADRLPDALPAERLEVRIARPEAADAQPGCVRTVEARARGAAAEAALARWRAALSEAESVELSSAA